MKRSPLPRDQAMPVSTKDTFEATPFIGFSRIPRLLKEK